MTMELAAELSSNPPRRSGREADRDRPVPRRAGQCLADHHQDDLGWHVPHFQRSQCTGRRNSSRLPPGGRAVADEARPGPDDVDAGAAAAFGRSALRGAAPGSNGAAGIADGDANAVRLDCEVELDLVLFRQPAMVVEVGDQFLDDDAKPRQLVLAEPLGTCPNARAASAASTDRPAAAKPAGQAIRI